MILLLACTSALPTPRPDGAPPVAGDTEMDVELLPGTPDAGQEPDENADIVFDPTTVHTITLTIPDAGVAALRADPTTQVNAALTFDELAFPSVGVRVKGSASFQSIDQKPALKIELDEYVPGARLHGLERLTLNNEVWDPTMMAETMAYATFRGVGAPAPRTGYASVTLNDRLLGVYTLLEPMDDHFVDHNWPDSEGGMWEMTVGCDFDSDCACFEPQTTGDQFDPDGVRVGCAAVASRDLDVLRATFDWDALLSFLAVQIAVNHPDSYSYNLNNYFVYQDPADQRLTLTPWGADSTFIYAYPVSTPNPDCVPLYLDVDATNPKGVLARICAADADCSAELDARIGEVADWMEAEDLVGQMSRTRDLLDPLAPLETWVNWTLDDRDARVACFLEWTGERPDDLRSRSIRAR